MMPAQLCAMMWELPRHMQSTLRACCPKDLNPHPLLLPQSATSVSKLFILKPPLETDGCQHRMISSTVMTPKRNFSSLTQLREYPEHKKENWNDLPKLHHTENTEHNHEHYFRLCASQTSASISGSAQAQGRLKTMLQRAQNSKHYTKTTVQRRGEKKQFYNLQHLL